MRVVFDHKIGFDKLILSDTSAAGYRFANNLNQKFNVTKFGYYISAIELRGPDGTIHSDELSVGPLEEDVKGHYYIDESSPSSRFLNLTSIPYGTYDHIGFTVGVGEEGIAEGAAGGVLDIANGAPFWNWNAGYIGFLLEGISPSSPQVFEDKGNGTTLAANRFQLHIGGWRDIPTSDDTDQKFYNNLVRIELDFDSPVLVNEQLSPEPHLTVDLLKWMDAVNLDFSTNYAIHSPGAGKPLADSLSKAFVFDHIHANAV